MYNLSSKELVNLNENTFFGTSSLCNAPTCYELDNESQNVDFCISWFDGNVMRIIGTDNNRVIVKGYSHIYSVSPLRFIQRLPDYIERYNSSNNKDVVLQFILEHIYFYHKDWLVSTYNDWKKDSFNKKMFFEHNGGMQLKEKIELYKKFCDNTNADKNAMINFLELKHPNIQRIIKNKFNLK